VAARLTAERRAPGFFIDTGPAAAAEIAKLHAQPGLLLLIRNPHLPTAVASVIGMACHGGLSDDLLHSPRCKSVLRHKRCRFQGEWVRWRCPRSMLSECAAARGRLTRAKLIRKASKSQVGRINAVTASLVDIRADLRRRFSINSCTRSLSPRCVCL